MNEENNEMLKDRKSWPTMAVSLGMLPGAVLKIHLLLGVYLEDKGNVARWKQSTIILRPFPVKNKREKQEKKPSFLINCFAMTLSSVPHLAFVETQRRVQTAALLHLLRVN